MKKGKCNEFPSSRKPGERIRSWGIHRGHNCPVFIDFPEITKQMFVQIGLHLFHLFPRRVDVSLLEKKKKATNNNKKTPTKNKTKNGLKFIVVFPSWLLNYCRIPLAPSSSNWFVWKELPLCSSLWSSFLFFPP